MAQLKLYLFGPPRLERHGRPIQINLRKALALLIYLAVTRQPHSRDALATLFWPEKDQQIARANLRRTLYDLSQLLDAQLLAIAPETMSLSPTADLWLDVACFQRALADHLPATLLPDGVPADALLALVEAAEYYSADFLAGFTLPDAPEFDDWQFFQREALRGAFARLLQQVIATYVAQAKFDEAVRYARRWLLLDPLEEAVHRQLMQLYAQAGQHAAAVRQYDECVRILAAELDVSPAAETTALYEAIRTRRFPVPDKKTRRGGDKSRLAVFQGGFDQAAAVAVAGADLLTLAELVDKAWVYRTADNRYQMHELLRQFAAEKLAETDADRTETEARHTTFYLQQMAQREQALIGPAQRATLDAINAEIDNVQAAWRRAADRCDQRLLDGACQALYRFYHIRSHYGAGKEDFAYALEQLPAAAGDADNGCAQLPSRLRARLGAFHLALGELDAAEAAFTVVLRDSTEPRELAFVYAQLGNSLRLRGQRQAAQAALQQSLPLARTSGDQNRMAKVLLGLADIASSFSDFAEGERYAREALALCRELQRPDLTAHVLASLAWAVNSQGAYAESARYYRESLAIAEAIGNPFSIGLAIQFLGWVAFCAGGVHLTEALAQYERAIVIFRQIGDQFHLSMTLGDYALAASEHRNFTAAFQAAQEGLAIAEALGQHSMTAYNLNGMGIAACGLHDLAASRRYLWRSLQITSTTQMYDHGAVALYWLAHLLLNESQTAPSAAQRLASQVQALELLSLVTHSPAPWQLFRERAQRTQAEVAATLPADLAAAIARGQ